MSDSRDDIFTNQTRSSADDVFSRADYLRDVLDAAQIGAVIVDYQGDDITRAVSHRTKTLEKIFGIGPDYPSDISNFN